MLVLLAPCLGECVIIVVVLNSLGLCVSLFVGAIVCVY